MRVLLACSVSHANKQLCADKWQLKFQTQHTHHSRMLKAGFKLVQFSVTKPTSEKRWALKKAEVGGYRIRFVHAVSMLGAEAKKLAAK